MNVRKHKIQIDRARELVGFGIKSASLMFLIFILGGCSDGGGGGTSSRSAAEMFIGATIETLPPESGDEQRAAAERFFPVSDTPRYRMVDVNGDGFSDIVEASLEQGIGSVRLGLGDGTFGDFQVFQLPAEVDAHFSGGLEFRVADFTGDGTMDMLMTPAPFFSGGNIHVYPGLGDGAFLDPVLADMAMGFIDLVSTGDINEDGRSDVLIGGIAAATIFLGNPDGSLTEFATIDVSYLISQLIDFDGDEHLDIVTSPGTQDISLVTVALGHGDGTFDPEVPHQFEEILDPFMLRDLNGDGLVDRVGKSSDFPGTVAASLNNGDGTFSVSERISIPTGDRPGIAIVDFDGDSIMDIVIEPGFGWTIYSDDLYVVFGNGDGTFGDPVLTEFGHPVSAFRVGRINGDGVQDVLIRSRISGEVYYEGHPDGTFTVNPKFPTDGALGLEATWDLNGDGFLDIVADNRDRDAVSILHGNGDGTFGTELRIPVGGAPGLSDPLDLNHDSVLDLLTANTDTGDISVLIGNGDGTFQPESRYPVGLGPRIYGRTDLNADTHVDIVTYNLQVEDFSVLLGNGDGTFQSEQRLSFPDHRSIGGLKLDDLDGDGFPDITLAGRPTNTTSNLNTIGTFYSDSMGGFEPVSFLLTGVDSTFRIVDMYSDGVPDLVAIRPETQELVISFGEDDKIARPEATVPIAEGSSSLEVIDLDGDGDLDFVVGTRVDPTISFYFLQPDGSIEFGYSAPTSFFPLGISMKDINNDGKLDLLVTELDLNLGYLPVSVEIFLGQGGGQFTRTDSLAYDLGRGSRRFDLDMNGDGLLDFVAAPGGTVSVFLNTGNGTFADRARFAAPPGGGLILGDFDHDGNVDFVTSSGSALETFLYVMLNQSPPTGQLVSAPAPVALFDDERSVELMRGRDGLSVR